MFYSGSCRAQCPVAYEVMAPGALIDVGQYVGSLSFHVWEKMHKMVKYSEYKLVVRFILSLYSWMDSQGGGKAVVL